MNKTKKDKKSFIKNPIISGIIGWTIGTILTFIFQTSLLNKIFPPKIDLQITENTGETNNSLLIDIKNSKKWPSGLIKEFRINYLQIPGKITNSMVSPIGVCEINHYPTLGSGIGTGLDTNYGVNVSNILAESIFIKCDTIKKGDTLSISLNYIPIDPLYKNSCIESSISTLSPNKTKKEIDDSIKDIKTWCEKANPSPTSSGFDCSFVWSYDIGGERTVGCNKDLLKDFDLPSFKNRQKKHDDFWNGLKKKYGGAE